MTSFSHVRAFYMAVSTYTYMVKKFPFKNTTIQTLGFVNLLQIDQLLELASIITWHTNHKELLDGILDYQLPPDNEFPQYKHWIRVGCHLKD